MVKTKGQTRCKCRECGGIECREWIEFRRAAPPRCLSCGGVLDVVPGDGIPKNLARQPRKRRKDKARTKLTRAERLIVGRAVGAGLHVVAGQRLGLYKATIFLPQKLVVIDVENGRYKTRDYEGKRKRRAAWLSTAGLRLVVVYEDEADDWVPDDVMAMPDSTPSETGQVMGRLGAWAERARRKMRRKKP